MPPAGPRILAPPVSETEFGTGLVGAVFSDAGLLAAALGDGAVQLVATDGGRQAVPAHEGAALCLALDLDGRGFVTGGDDGRLVRSSPDGVATELLRAPGRQIDVLAVSRVARSIAVGVGRKVRLLDPQGAVQACASGHASTVSGLAFNPKGKRLAVAHYGGVTLWWTATLGRSPKHLSWRGSHIGVSWSPDGTHLMTAMQECELHGWRVADGEDLAMRGYTAKVRSMDWSARPPVLATSGAECVVAWSFAGSGPQGKRPIEVGRGIGRLVTQIAIHPSRLLVATGFDDGQVAICELSADRESRAVRIRGQGGGRISTLAWSPDGARLAAGTAGGTLAVFDLAGAAP